MVPQIDNLVDFDEEQITIPSKTYKLGINEDNGNDRIIGFVDDKEAIRQAVYHILSIERYTYDIYDDDYGVELEQYIGQDFDYISATIQETLNDALTQDERILDIVVNDIQKLTIDSILIKFTVITRQEEEIEMEVNINV